MIIGICGGTGSGKTTIARNIVTEIGSDNVILLNHDSYYHDLANMPANDRHSVNFDHPDAYNSEMLVDHIKCLKSGNSIEMPIYDFKTHTRSKQTKHIEPKPVIIVEGILIFAESRILDILDIRVFVDTPDDIRFIRRLQRDISERGRTIETVVAQYFATVRPMHFAFVKPSKNNADIIIPDGGNREIGVELLCANIREELSKQSPQTETKNLRQTVNEQ